MIFAKILRNAAAEKLAKTVTKNNLRVGKYVARYLPRLEIQQKFALVCQVSISETCSYILRHCVVNMAIILITNITTIIVLIIITTFSPSSQNPLINPPHCIVVSYISYWHLQRSMPIEIFCLGKNPSFISRRWWWQYDEVCWEICDHK